VDKIIVTVMLIIGGIVAAFAVFNGIYPAIERSGSAITSASDSLNERIKSDIRIIQVNDNGTTVDAWVKNVGTSDIVTVENSDIFLVPRATSPESRTAMKAHRCRIGAIKSKERTANGGRQIPTR